jgi:hypothetical protein
LLIILHCFIGVTPPCRLTTKPVVDPLMTKAILGLLLVGALLYVAGVRPEVVKQSIETQRMNRATVAPLGDDRGDWG